MPRPEPTSPLLGFGKRDAAYDRWLPVPFARLGKAGLEILPAGELEVLALNDHHAHVRLGSNGTVAVEDLVGMYVSYPAPASKSSASSQ
ncbi:MAG: hypothetical protein WB801_04735 [Candidatus Dormiibacterota bacterium]